MPQSLAACRFNWISPKARHLDADVLVIGAGAAGLAAAGSLGRRSLEVIVLEARDRIGGRAWSKPSTRVAAPVELGAEFIHGRAEETMALLRDAGAAAVDTGGASWISDGHGELRREDDDFRWPTRIFDGARALASDQSVDRFLRRFDDDATMRTSVSAARAFVEGFDAADPAIASVWGIADELRSGVDYATARPIGGYGVIFQHLRSAAATSVQLCLSTIVRKISWRRGSVSVEVTSDRGETRTIRAQTAVITLPIGVLRHRGDATEVVFEPELPASKQAALTNIEMGHAVKVALQFRTAFWERVKDRRYHDAAVFRGVGRPFATYWTQLPRRSELVIAWVGGPKAAALRGVPSSELVASALSGFGELVGEPDIARKEFDAGFMHDWSLDPFARGAYSYLKVGGGAARTSLASPVDDTLFFAGEATSDDGQGGTVNGALVAGERAAREVATSLGAAR
jgi:monoamine oxidase